MATDLIDKSEWPIENELDIPNPRGIGVNSYDREVIADDIVHYTYTIGIGGGQYDRIRLHRVVKESSYKNPIKTNKAIFFQHGDAKDFVGMLLPGLYSPTTPNDYGMAVYLARNNVDVWGIDQAWNLVPMKLRISLSWMIGGFKNKLMIFGQGWRSPGWPVI